MTINPLVICCIAISLLLISCISVYKPVSKEVVVDELYHEVSKRRNADIGFRQNILKETRNKRYAKMERKNKVSLVAIRIANTGDEAIRLPEDLHIQSETDSAISVLLLDEALELLVNQVTDESSEPYSEEQGALITVGRIAGDGSKVIANASFIADLQEHYLNGLLLSPGEEFIGFMAIDSPRDVPVSITLR